VVGVAEHFEFAKQIYAAQSGAVAFGDDVQGAQPHYGVHSFKVGYGYICHKTTDVKGPFLLCGSSEWLQEHVGCVSAAVVPMCQFLYIHASPPYVFRVVNVWVA
jgi:hypothetical protein